MKNPFFSIIIPTYNRAQFLSIAINSVLQQTFNNFELIIIDDGSDDNTSTIINRYPDKRIVYIPCLHHGVSNARNTGIHTAKGEFICFLDSDDRFRHEKLEITFDYIKRNPQYKIFHTEELWYRQGTLLSQKIHHKKPTGFVFHEAVKLCCISISTTAINKEVFKRTGYFDEKFPACEDYDFWLKATATFPIYLIPKYLTIKEGGHSDQQSKKYPAMDIFRIQALTNILESKILTKELTIIALEELKKKCSIYIQGAIKRNKINEADYYKNIVLKFEKSV